MKSGIHPKYVEATITCSCGNTWKTRSTKESVHLDVCSNCHPYFTGEQRIVDTAGRVERFLKRYRIQNQ
ncbi:MAG TPA: 50S ribosomal protein L31 [Dehalococcoidia bacterium]|nr:50S ribosomal protein L31 [Dehalococcoidia bacterium]